MKIGEIMAADREITLNEGKKTVTVTVANKGDRPVQVGSHFHFFEVNKCLSFDREKAYGYHLDIPSGTSVRFEPGEEKEVQLTEMGGRQRVFGLNDLTRAQATDDTKAASMETAKLKRISVRRDNNEYKKFPEANMRQCMARLQEIRYVWQIQAL